MFIPYDPKAARKTTISLPEIDPRYGASWGSIPHDFPVEPSSAFNARVQRTAQPIAMQLDGFNLMSNIGIAQGCTSGPALIRPQAMRSDEV